VVSGFLQRFLQSGKFKSLGLFMACDLLEHLGSESVSTWPLFMEALLAAVSDEDAQLRQAACYGVNVAARVPEFAQFALIATQRLVAVVKSGPKLKKFALATDNAVAALGWLVEKQGAALGSGTSAEVLGLWVRALPLSEDDEEGICSHKQLLRLVRAGMLGSQGEQLDRAIQVFAQIYKKEVSDEETNRGIVELFKQIGPAALAQKAAQFSQKEKNQIQRILELKE
jgi:hypothetical protein